MGRKKSFTSKDIVKRAKERAKERGCEGCGEKKFVPWQADENRYI